MDENPFKDIEIPPMPKIPEFPEETFFERFGIWILYAFVLIMMGVSIVFKF